jgi:hypothetical protein
LQAAVDSAAGEVEKARAVLATALSTENKSAEANLKKAKDALAAMKAPESATPFADRIGMAPWAYDSMVVAFGSFAINGLACCLMIFGTHAPRSRRLREKPRWIRRLAALRTWGSVALLDR